MDVFFSWVEKMETLTATATIDPEGFLGHPVNAFKLMKRLNTEWGEVEDLVLRDMSDGQCHVSYLNPLEQNNSPFVSKNLKRNG